MGPEGIRQQKQVVGDSADAPNEMKFRREVRIGGLPYIFDAKISASVDAKDIWLQLYVPEVELGDERLAGFVHAIDGGHTDVRLSGRIRSYTAEIPPNSKYSDARGIGRFLMSNLLALCDMNGWTMKTTIAATEPTSPGRPGDLDIDDWMSRLGFDDNGVRAPGQPDPEAEIVKELQK